MPNVAKDPRLASLAAVELALSQIIANAAKFSNPPSTIKVSAFVKHGELLISVHDDGVGLTTEERIKLSERFYRSQRHIGKIPGSGLGLWVANTFITSSGGKLEATSPGESKGTTIRILSPISHYAGESETAMQEA